MRDKVTFEGTYVGDEREFIVGGVVCAKNTSMEYKVPLEVFLKLMYDKGFVIESSDINEFLEERGINAERYLAFVKDPLEAEETEPTEAEPTETEPTEAEPTEAEPTEAEPTEAEPTEAEPTEAEPTETEPTEEKHTRKARSKK